jgi:hypothetical protein
MTICSDPLRYRPLRAPKEDRAVLAEPPLEEAGETAACHVELRRGWTYDFQGRRLDELSAAARRELIDEAWRYTAAYRDPPALPPGAESLIFLAGHQPELFHPGVWLKNFALGALARRHGAVGINLVIDGDLAKPAVLAVPAGSPEHPHQETVALDRHGPPVAYEERGIIDREMFDDFDRRLVERLRPLVSRPLVADYWPLVRRRAAEGENLGASIAQGRHQLEGRWGLDTLEVPQSRLCDAPAFRWFLVHLLDELPRWHEAYHGALGEYRRAHRLRGDAQPVPDLARCDDWLETPFWIWTAEHPARQRLFARRAGGELVLADESGGRWALPLAAGGDPARAVARLAELRSGGVKIRSRALVTTTWARLVLGDLFLHGIGGAKYDQVTDRIIAEFFGLAPPRFMVVSATLLLPVARRRVSADQLRAVRRHLRELTFHPERYLDAAGRCGDPNAEAQPGALAIRNGAPPRPNPDAAALTAEKLRWITTPPTRENARARCRAIRRLNEALQPWVAAERRRAERLEAETAEALRADTVLAWRAYAFCLYPEGALRNFFGGLLPTGAEI